MFQPVVISLCLARSLSLHTHLEKIRRSHEICRDIREGPRKHQCSSNEWVVGLPPVYVCVRNPCQYEQVLAINVRDLCVAESWVLAR